jgi:hypothetical protein
MQLLSFSLGFLMFAILLIRIYLVYNIILELKEIGIINPNIQQLSFNDIPTNVLYTDKINKRIKLANSLKYLIYFVVFLNITLVTFLKTIIT